LQCDLHSDGRTHSDDADHETGLQLHIKAF
jgi:hypothetical protein